MSKLKTLLAGAAAACGLMAIASPAQAQYRYIGEIYPAGFNFCPRDTATADGQLLAISQYTALFSLLGTQYGGDGRTTFALPDMRGRLPMHTGHGPGLTSRRVGERVGVESTTLTVANLPQHMHFPRMQVSRIDATSRNPINGYVARSASNIYEEGTAPTGDFMAADAIQSNPVGQGQPANNVQPSLALTYCVVLNGLYPSRS